MKTTSSDSVAQQIALCLEKEKERIGFKSKTKKDRLKRKNKHTIRPQININHWNEFKKNFFESDCGTNRFKKCKLMQKCIQPMELHFTATEFIRKAIANSLLTRNWNAFTKLLFIFIKIYNLYRGHCCNPFIRHMLQILSKCHPRIKGTDFEKLIHSTLKKYENQRNKLTNSSNLI